MDPDLMETPQREALQFEGGDSDQEKNAVEMDEVQIEEVKET